MQYGTFGTVPGLAAAMLLRRRPRTAVAVGLGGTAAWLLAKAVKPLVGRARPAPLLADVHVRGKEEGDLGFPSGHAAVSAALTTALWPVLPRPWRAACVGLSGFVSFARMYVGAHLPLDVVGGAGLGVAVGSLAKLVARERSQSESP
jgi:glycosyltransferase 2 family protein